MSLIPVPSLPAGHSVPVPYLPCPNPCPPMSTVDLVLFLTLARDDARLAEKFCRLLATLSRILGARGARGTEIDDILGHISLRLSAGGWSRIKNDDPLAYLRRMARNELIAMRRHERRGCALDENSATGDDPEDLVIGSIDESRRPALATLRDRYLLAEDHFNSPALRGRLRAIWKLTILHVLSDRKPPGTDACNAYIDARTGRAPAATGREREMRNQDVSNLRHRLRVRLEFIRLMEEHPGQAMRALLERPERLGRGQRPEWYRKRLVLLRFLRDEVLHWHPVAGGPSRLDLLLAALGGGAIPKGERDALRRLGLRLLARWPQEPRDTSA